MSDLNNVNLEEVKYKLYDKLKLGGWEKLRTFIFSNAFDEILEQLYKEAKDNERFTPPLKNVFRAFEQCNYDNLKCVIIGQDPYPYPLVADGIAFSASNGTFLPPSIKHIFKEIEKTVYPNKGYSWDPNLERWSNQGILLINSALTTSVGKVGKHYDLWQSFIAFLIDILNTFKPGLIYVFMGKVAKSWEEQVDEGNHKLYTTHPASAAHTLNGDWDCDDVFNRISDLMHNYYKYKMIW